MSISRPGVTSGHFSYLDLLHSSLSPGAIVPNLPLLEGWSANPFHGFPQLSRIPPLPQTLSLGQLEPHCVNSAAFIRVTWGLSKGLQEIYAFVPQFSASAGTRVRRFLVFSFWIFN